MQLLAERQGLYAGLDYTAEHRRPVKALRILCAAALQHYRQMKVGRQGCLSVSQPGNIVDCKHCSDDELRLDDLYNFAMKSLLLPLSRHRTRCFMTMGKSQQPGRMSQPGWSSSTHPIGPVLRIPPRGRLSKTSK